jgi:glycine betaine/choline ABC-type transport system substrate-binding protein
MKITLARRQLLKAGVGVAGGTMLAGCSGGSTDSGSTETGADEEQSDADPADEGTESDDTSDASFYDDGGEPMEIHIASKKGWADQSVLASVASELLDANTDHEINHLSNVESYSDLPETNADLAEAYGQDDPDVHVLYDFMTNIWLTHPPRNDETISDPDESHDRLTEQMEAEYPVQILDRADWESTQVLYAEEGTLEEAGIWTISDLATSVNAGNYDLRFAFDARFSTHTDRLTELLDHYGFEDEAVEAWKDAGGFVEVAKWRDITSAIKDGEADIGLGHSTGPWMEQAIDNPVLLEDDEQFWPPNHPVGLVHDDVATEEVITELNKMPDAIPDAATMRSLILREGDHQEVVRSHLRENGFIE